MREYLQKKRYAIFIILSGLMTFIICLGVYLLDVRPNVRNAVYDVNINNDELDYTNQSITQSDTVIQTFAFKDKISGIKLAISNLDRDCDGNLNVKLYDADKNVIVAEWQYNLNSNDNSNYRTSNGELEMDFSNDSNCIISPGTYYKGFEDTNYRLEISSDIENDNSPGIYYTNMKVNDNTSLKIGNKIVEGDLYLKIIGKGTYFISKIFIILSVILVIFVMFAFYLIYVKNFQVQNIFLICGLIIGFVYMFIMTPYSISDEYGHITTAYRYSNVFLGKGYQTENGNMLKRRCDLKEYNLDERPSAATYYGIINHFFDKCSESDNELIEVPGYHIGNIWQYIPTSIGITLARLLNLGYIPLIYMGRIFNFLFFILMIYVAIKKLPFGNITLFTVAMMPMALHQGMSFSYDCIVYALSFVLISYVFNIAFTKSKVKIIDILVILVCSGILSTCKAGIFIFICLICLAIPKNRFKNKKRYYGIIISIFICAVCMLLIFNFVKVSKAVTMTNNDNLQNFVSTRGYTYSDILKSPGWFIKVVYNTIKINIDFYVLSTIGEYLSWSTVNPVKISTIIIISYIIILIVSALKTENEETILRLKHKFLFISICILIFGAFTTVAFTWTPYGDNVIFGLQGRYFMTFLPLIAFLFRNNTVVLRKNLNKEIMFIMCSLEAITIINLFVNIFIN